MNKVIQWEIKCMKCSFALLSSDEVVFHKENEKSVHLLVEQQKIVVQGDEKNNEPAAITIHTNSKGKILRKIRNTHLSKATYSPFKLLCVHCEEAIGSQGPVRGKGDLEYRLEYRKCTLAWQNLKHEFESPVYKPGCKWAKALELLTRLRISINLSYMQLPENLSCESESNEPRSPQNDPIVTPTIDYLTQHFSPNCRISQMRKYQVEMAIGALMQDTVIYLPTGCGKTLIGVKVIQEMKKSNPMKVAVFLVPTVPLVAQQAAYVRRESDLRVAEFSGQSKGPRLDSGAFSSLHTRFDVLVMTPQYLLNQLTDQSVVIEGFCVLIFDEAHHATGDHPYNNILRLLYATELRVRPRIIGLTASPFSNKWNERSTNKAFDRILASFYNASLDTPTLYEDDLEQYSIPKEARWITVKETKQETSLRRGLKLHIASFERMINTLDREGNMIECSLLGNYDRDENEMSFFIGRLRKFAEAVEKKDKNGPLYIIAEHLVQIAATLRMLSVEGASKVAEQLKCFFEILARPTTALLTQKHVLTRVSFEKHLLPILAEFDHANKSESSSLNCSVEEKCSSRVLAIQQIIGSMKFGRDSRAIIFVRRRSTAKLLARALSEIPSLNRLNPTKFVGQHFYEGMSWEEEQKPTLESFRMGRTRLLIATNVLEEGLDVPQCSLVILFDGLHGITSLVQSRGRARKRDGEFVILCSEEELVSQKEALRRERAMNVSVRQHARKLPFKYVLANTLQQIWNKPFPVSLSPNNVLKSDKNDSEMDEQVCEIEGKSLQNIRLVGFENLQQQIQEWILKAIRIFLSIRFFDKQWSLLSVQVPEKGDFGQLYDAFCRHLDYSLIHKTENVFYLELMDTVTIESSDDMKKSSTIFQVKGVQRGRILSDHSGFEVKDDFSLSFSGALLFIMDMGPSNPCLVLQGQDDVRMEFQLRSLVDASVIFNYECGIHELVIIAAFTIPPLCFQGDYRVCRNFQNTSLVFSFCLGFLDEDSAWREAWCIRQFFYDRNIKVRDMKMTSITQEFPMKTQFPPQCQDSFSLQYAWNCFLSKYSYALDSDLPLEFLEQWSAIETASLKEKVLLNLEYDPTLPQKKDVVKCLKDYIEQELPVLKEVAAITQKEPQVYRVVVTLTRVMVYSPCPPSSNRVFRKFGAENFLYVYFRDEALDSLNFSEPSTYKRITKVLSQGIEFGKGFHFKFLCATPSQIRNHACMFTCLDPEKIRTWIGKLAHISQPGKYFKRMGQAFSATKPILSLDRMILENPYNDITNDEGYIFSDGCGEISYELAREVSTKMGLYHVPSAFQIRAGGAKGVLVVSTTLKNSPARFRKSMCKFPSPHTNLEVVAFSGKSDCVLSRQIIMLLSDLGVNGDVFLSLQDEFLGSLRRMINCSITAMAALKSSLPASLSVWIESLLKLGLDVFSEPFLCSLLHSIYVYKLHNTVLRARIPVSKGRILMGVVDFSGFLQYGEVFIQISHDTEYSQIERLKDGLEVVVCRSPCHHPGDIRLLTCKSNGAPDSFKSLVDCIVFPSVGPRPHPDECSGGDLDGDMYVVIWDRRLIPNRNNIHQPMDFGSNTVQAGNSEKKPTKELENTDLIEFFYSSAKNDILGVASNAHLAYCDTSPTGSLDPNAKKLARICANQVDQNRSDQDILIVQQFMPASYPDFMENSTKPAYKSKKVLGKMYRRCKNLTEISVDWSENLKIKNPHFLCKGYEKYLKDATLLYNKFKFAVKGLLQMSGGSLEAEIATGMIVTPHALHKADFFRFGEDCQRRYFQLVQDFREDFTKKCRNLPVDEWYRIAAAWYDVAYSDQDIKNKCLGFAWILVDYLVMNMGSNVDCVTTHTMFASRKNKTSYLTRQLQISLLGYIQENREEMLSCLLDRLQAKCDLEIELNTLMGMDEKCQLVLFGSSSLLTFDPQSDLDCAVFNKHTIENENDNSHINLKQINEEMKKMNFFDAKFKDRARVPVLSIEYDTWKIDLCGEETNGPQKTIYFRQYIEKYDFFWPCLFILIQWGKANGIIRNHFHPGEAIFFPTGFIWMFLHFCVKKKFITWIDPSCYMNIHTGNSSSSTMISKNTIANNLNQAFSVSFWIQKFDRCLKCSTLFDQEEKEENEYTSPKCAASVLLCFFEFFGSLSTSDELYGFEDPFDFSNNMQMEKERIVFFRQLCHQTLHALYLSRGQAKILLQQGVEKSTQQKSHFTLSRALTRRIQEGKEFYARKLIADACELFNGQKQVQVCFVAHPNRLKKNQLIVEIIGKPCYVELIEKKIHQIEEELGCHSNIYAMKQNNNHYHHAGSSLLLFEGALSQEEKIGFSEYFGNAQVQHTFQCLHQSHLLTFGNGNKWKQHALNLFYTRLNQQILKLFTWKNQRQDKNIIHYEMKASIRFGHHYLIHLPRSFHSETIAYASIEKLEEEFERGRAARELYKSVFIEKQKDKQQQQQQQQQEKEEKEEQEQKETDPSNVSNKIKTKKNNEKNEFSGLSHASQVETNNKGVTHSFYPCIHQDNFNLLKIFPLYFFKHSKSMKQLETKMFYRASLIYQGEEFTIIMDANFNFLQLKSRPHRWLNTTLKMRQELIVEEEKMETRIPDIRYYISTNAQVPFDHELFHQINRSKNKILCLSQKSKFGLRIHQDFPLSNAIVSVRQVEVETFVCDELRDVEFVVLNVKEFSSPNTKDPTEGFQLVREKVEAEFRLTPNFTDELGHFASYKFAHFFMNTGLEFVEFLRAHNV